MEVLCGERCDISSWMELVREVSPVFPGLETEEALEEHKNTVLRFMGEKRALCVKIYGKIAGVLLFSVKHNMICCLAVSPAHRKEGIASALLAAALERLDRSRDITVNTFREGDEKGVAARALYKKFGFAEDKLVEEFGYPNQVFILRPKA
ncbi:MAG: GNAT family N-acetyltransferase [Oscillospiraceae bacterium]|nr:GNAT family N-acetyltransferase [Oscillospiraceae bacterium]